MNEIDFQLQSLQQKLAQLLKNYQQLQKQHVQIQKELEKTSEQLQQKNNLIAQLEQKVTALHLSSPDRPNEEKVLLEKKIDGYLKEIEKCLTLLNA